MKRKRSKPAVEADLEATAELPVIDFAPAVAKSPESTASTDVFPIPAIPAGAPELADGLREAEHQLARARRRAEELETELRAAGERQVVLEAQLAEAGERQVMLETQLDEADTRCAALEAQLQSRLAIELQSAPVRHSAADFAELRRRCERQQEALTSWQGLGAVNEALLADAEARNTLLESQLARSGEALRALEGKRGSAASRDGEKHPMDSELAMLKTEFGALQTVLAAVRERQQQSEQLAEAEAARARRLEIEIQASVALLGGQQQGPEQPDRDDAARHAVAHKPPADVPLRVLVRQEGGAEVVYPIGRRTGIGRMPDNDIQIDTTNVSRHHAVLLSSAEHCIVEDLNSTNGVLVNGQRVERQVLRDGDTLRVGKVEFRFQQRS